VERQVAGIGRREGADEDQRRGRRDRGRDVLVRARGVDRLRERDVAGAASVSGVDREHLELAGGLLGVGVHLEHASDGELVTNHHRARAGDDRHRRSTRHERRGAVGRVGNERAPAVTLGMDWSISKLKPVMRSRRPSSNCSPTRPAGANRPFCASTRAAIAVGFRIDGPVAVTGGRLPVQTLAGLGEGQERGRDRAGRADVVREATGRGGSHVEGDVEARTDMAGLR
jgi:hypothetical protein